MSNFKVNDQINDLEQIDIFKDSASKVNGLLIALLSNFRTDGFGGDSAGLGNDIVATLFQAASNYLDVMGKALFNAGAEANECLDDIEGFNFEKRVLRAQSIITSLLSENNFETLKNNNTYSLLELAIEQIDVLTDGANKLTFG